MVIVTGNQENYLAKIEVERGTAYPSYADVPKERGGDNLYMRPGETLQGALGSCMNITARRCLNRDNIPYDRVEVQVELSVEENVTHIYTNLEIIGKISSADKERIIREVQDCPVCKLLRGEIQLHTEMPK